jgi:hypothetical protein
MVRACAESPPIGWHGVGTTGVRVPHGAGFAQSNGSLSRAESRGQLEPVVNRLVCGPETFFFSLAHLPTSGSYSALPTTLKTQT